MSDVHTNRPGQVDKKRLVFYIRLPSKTVAISAMEQLSEQGFYCHTLDRDQGQWYFLAYKPTSFEKMDRKQLAIVKQVVEEKGGDVEGWKVTEANPA